VNQETQVETIRAEVAPVVARVQWLVVRTPEDYTGAADFLKAIKAAQKKVADHFGPMKAAAHAAWKKITATEAEAAQPLVEAERGVKRLMIDYQAEQERIRQAEQRKLQAEADALAASARKALEAKAAKMKTEAKREEYMERAAEVAAPVVTVAPVVPTVTGQAIRTTWKARLIDMQSLTGIPPGDVRLSLIAFDQSAANKLAVATKGALAVQGVEWYQEQSLASRGA
jgi:hypothetical protein